MIGVYAYREEAWDEGWGEMGISTVYWVFLAGLVVAGRWGFIGMS